MQRQCSACHHCKDYNQANLALTQQPISAQLHAPCIAHQEVEPELVPGLDVCFRTQHGK